MGIGNGFVGSIDHSYVSLLFHRLTAHDEFGQEDLQLSNTLLRRTRVFIIGSSMLLVVFGEHEHLLFVCLHSGTGMTTSSTTDKVDNNKVLNIIYRHEKRQ
mmetsp:Transcript_3811/g.6292  ORF Transcript_3811/g.6292 Transcript_3811/m.6292 type:complete len:101 (+) Transcript_3811:2-304(+)